MLHAVIMAGGSGTRFWPASRAGLPKQLLKLVGERSMLEATVDRLGSLVPAERVLVVTAERLSTAVKEQLPELPAENILAEPCKRDTAPCIGLAAFHVLRDDPEAVMAVLPSDHVIEPSSAFVAALQAAAELVVQRPGRIVTFGITPTYPAQSFGYVERGAPVEGLPTGAPPTFTVRQFREKPKAEVAQQYLAQGGFYWNSGIFVWRARTILDQLKQHVPQIYAHLERIAAARGKSDYQQVFTREFTSIEGKSIDYAVMEHAQDVVVIEAPFTWDDVGSWQAIARLNSADEAGNTVQGRHLGVDTRGTIIRTTDDHLVVTLGIENCIIVHTPEATLVADKNCEESVRQLVKLLEERGWSEYL